MDAMSPYATLFAYFGLYLIFMLVFFIMLCLLCLIALVCYHRRYKEPQNSSTEAKEDTPMRRPCGDEYGP